MNLVNFLYQTEFQLSSSSGNGRVEEKLNSPASFCRSRYAPPLRRPVRHIGKTLFPQLFIAPMTSASMSITAMNAELRMLNCAAQSVCLTEMDDPNIPPRFKGCG
ncbi:hypothetical protein AMECASPLE_029120 [Ameca splendens]|uniref:Uncharacterized protein n=1 Tax=Ameca splendens TaxID=208324 RepID=A0ABV0Y634_9TELE